MVYVHLGKRNHNEEGIMIVGKFIGLRHSWRNLAYDSEGRDEDALAIDSDDVLGKGGTDPAGREATSFAARKNRHTRETLHIGTVTNGSVIGIMLRPGSDRDFTKGVKASFEERHPRYSGRMQGEDVDGKECARVLSEAEIDKGYSGTGAVASC